LFKSIFQEWKKALKCYKIKNWPDCLLARRFLCTSCVYDMTEAEYPIGLVAGITGSSAQVIRIWEQRYRDALE